MFMLLCNFIIILLYILTKEETRYYFCTNKTIYIVVHTTFVLYLANRTHYLYIPLFCVETVSLKCMCATMDENFCIKKMKKNWAKRTCWRKYDSDTNDSHW